MAALLKRHKIFWDKATSGFIPCKSSLSGTTSDSLCVFPHEFLTPESVFTHGDYLCHSVDIQATLDITDIELSEKRSLKGIHSNQIPMFHSLLLSASL